MLNGRLDADQCGSAAGKPWLALVGYIDQNGDVPNVCEGTNKLNDVDYYLARKRRTVDFHGLAPALWAATAMRRQTARLLRHGNSNLLAVDGQQWVFDHCAHLIPDARHEHRGVAGKCSRGAGFRQR